MNSIEKIAFLSCVALGLLCLAWNIRHWWRKSRKPKEQFTGDPPPMHANCRCALYEPTEEELAKWHKTAEAQRAYRKTLAGRWETVREAIGDLWRLAALDLEGHPRVSGRSLALLALGALWIAGLAVWLGWPPIEMRDK